MRRLAALLVVARRAAALQVVHAGATDAWPENRSRPPSSAGSKFAATIEPEALEKRVKELGGEVLRTVEFYGSTSTPRADADDARHLVPAGRRLGAQSTGRGAATSDGRRDESAFREIEAFPAHRGGQCSRFRRRGLSR